MFLGKELMLSLTYGGLSYSRCLIQKHHRGPPVNLWVLAAALSPYSPSPADPWAVLFVMAASTSEQICYLSTNWFGWSHMALANAARSVSSVSQAVCDDIRIARRIGLLLLYMGSSVTADRLSFKNK
ncbi:hypothetical protein FOXB_06927 [Fusarium oxysporum f. sp. conglutinans Fo5176]|uniref:Uncharacterized protein n=1 Tax=Fusarium oxysporum (strain Fo5176) TaxID=660025 RepID=F9FKJ8_FUSOF|nr:hypothetical protein FOXB_06927 [Fusarium oxysporum f. sp. conglutinans Fo5176]